MAKSAEESNTPSHGSFKKFCGFITLVAVIFVGLLFLSVLALKKPRVQPKPVSLKSIEFHMSPTPELNLILGLFVTVKNPNFGVFEYPNGTAFIYYHRKLVAEAPIESGVIPARSTQNISTFVEIMANQLASSPYFLADVSAGVLHLTASTTLRGKASGIFRIIKISATSLTECYISVFLKGFIDSICDSKLTI